MLLNRQPGWETTIQFVVAYSITNIVTCMLHVQTAIE